MWFFRNEDQSTEFNVFKPRSKFNPKGVDASIEMYVSRLEDEILDLDFSLKYSNLTREERKALKDLKDDTSIIIKQADKGSGVVVWDAKDYLLEAESQLSNTDVYEEVTQNAIPSLVEVIKYHLRNVKINGDISSETLDYFMVNNPNIGRFYLLPKIHKRLHSVPGRPVISNSGYYTEKISKFLDSILQPIAAKVKSYIRDTKDFLKRIRDLSELPEGCIFCTIDVVGLYPNIPHEEGLKALKVALEARENKNISTKSLMELAECVLKNNVFEHNGRIFRQKHGTAIGTKMAPSYAVLYMGDLEERFLAGSGWNPWVWWRYIDDIFMIWQYGEKELDDFIKLLNNFHPTIKFTTKRSRERIDFLDVEIIKRGNKLSTDLYTKPTDTHQYLEASSCHVYHSKKSIPYGQALRLNRICSEQSSFDKRCNQLESWLINRGYKEDLVREQVLKARKFNRNCLLDKGPRPVNKERKLILNITYHPKIAKLRKILTKIHLILTPNKEHQKVFSNVPILGFKKGKSLRDILVRAKVRQPVTESICKGCGGKRCKTCSILKVTNTFTNREKTLSYNIKGGELNCNSSNVIYLLECKTCAIQYVGSTSTKFRLRFNNYKNANRNFNLGKQVPQASLHQHFNQQGHKGANDWVFTIIERAPNINILRKRERFWQYNLNTFDPDGLNEREVIYDIG